MSKPEAIEYRSRAENADADAALLAEIAAIDLANERRMQKQRDRRKRHKIRQNIAKAYRTSSSTRCPPVQNAGCSKKPTLYASDEDAICAKEVSYSEDECVMCLDASPSVTFTNCRHHVCCAGCVGMLLKTPGGGKCPFCRIPLS